MHIIIRDPQPFPCTSSLWLLAVFAYKWSRHGGGNSQGTGWYV